MKDVLPSKARFIRDAALHFDAPNNVVTTARGDKIHYEYMIIGMVRFKNN
jgi:hypothetical protein